ncbi:MAG: hypothetical protein IKZ19_10065 [Clostridia bacterium]|nr:hypothetical protein [Clostridia bacterium]
MRADGYRVKDADPMYSLIPYFLTKRYDAMNMITIELPEEPMKAYINKMRREKTPISHLALLIAAYVQVIAEFPAINRFVKNKRIYQHKDITVSMVVLRPGNDNDTISKIYFTPEDTIFDVQRKIDEYITENRKDNNDNTFDKWVGGLLKFRPLVRAAIKIIDWLDNLGWLPMFVIKASPFHASLLVSNLASIRTNHIYHHVYEFGTTSLAITMGNMQEVPRRSRDGIVFDRCIPLGVVMDERICSGHYFAQAFARMREYLKTPELLETSYQAKHPEPAGE